MKSCLLLVISLMSMPLFAQSSYEVWSLFGLQGLTAEQERSQNIYLSFLDNSKISAGIYALKVGDQDHQEPHIKDEIYFILSGRSDFKVEDETTSVVPGDVLYVKAHLAHQFSNIREDLKILVWFSGSPKTDHDFDWKKWSQKELAAKSTPRENVWNEFIDLPTLAAGLYQLPQNLGGDSIQTHKADEINYVVKGNAKFRVGEEVTEVYPGSIIWVKAGNGHKFYDLKDDFEVYIMFVDNE